MQPREDTTSQQEQTVFFAERTTITGSIGIYGMIPNVKRLANDKLGITADFVSTSPNSNLSAFEPLTPTQRNAIQCNVNRGYELFVARCAKRQTQDHR